MASPSLRAQERAKWKKETFFSQTFRFETQKNFALALIIILDISDPSGLASPNLRAQERAGWKTGMQFPKMIQSVFCKKIDLNLSLNLFGLPILGT